MNNSVRYYLEELEARKQNIERTSQIIEKETKLYKQAVGPLEKNILAQKQAMQEMVINNNVSANLKDIVNEIAKEWEIDPNTLATQCFACFIHTPNLAKKYVTGGRDVSGYYSLNFKVYKTEGVPNYISFSSRVSTSEADKVASSLGLEFSKSYDYSKRSTRTLTQNQVNNMVVNFQLSDLIDKEGNAKLGNASNAIFNACDQYEKNSTSTM